VSKHKPLTEDRVLEILEEEASQPAGWWYLSFADDDGFRGGVFVWAQGFATAITVTRALKINPGGQVMGVPALDDWMPPEKYQHRLLTLAELSQLDEMISIKEWKKRKGKKDA
jgi:hypothetical protein